MPVSVMIYGVGLPTFPHPPSTPHTPYLPKPSQYPLNKLSIPKLSRQQSPTVGPAGVTCSINLSVPAPLRVKGATMKTPDSQPRGVTLHCRVRDLSYLGVLQHILTVK